jgi:predicted CoA-binding protein
MNLKNVKTIAVVGLSDNPKRSSYGVADYLSNHFKIIPVNPKIDSWKGLKAYRSLSEVPETIDLVNVFRSPEFVPEIVDEAIKLGIKRIWLQPGVINEAAKKKAEDHGIEVVMDECLAVVHRLSE